jgi:hypothetical protein
MVTWYLKSWTVSHREARVYLSSKLQGNSKIAPALRLMDLPPKVITQILDMVVQLPPSGFTYDGGNDWEGQCHGLRLLRRDFTPGSTKDWLDWQPYKLSITTTNDVDLFDLFRVSKFFHSHCPARFWQINTLCFHSTSALESFLEEVPYTHQS